MPVTVSEVVSALSRVVYVNQPAPLEDRLLAAGWNPGDPGSAGLHRSWHSAGLVATQFGRGSDALVEVTVDIRHPDPDDMSSEDAMLDEFEAKFASSVSEVRLVMGEADFVGEYGDQGFPEDVDAMAIAQWRHGGSQLAVNLKHEDMGLPFRITVTAS